MFNGDRMAGNDCRVRRKGRNFDLRLRQNVSGEQPHAEEERSYCRHCRSEGRKKGGDTVGLRTSRGQGPRARPELVPVEQRDAGTRAIYAGIVTPM